MGLVTLAKYKEYLKITDTILDTEIGDIANAVETRVKEYLHRDIESTTFTDEYYNGNGRNYMVLRQFPITAVSAIKEYDGLNPSNVEMWETLVQGTDYERLIFATDEATTLYMDGYTFESGMQNYKITYTAGYSTIPSDIQMACKELVKIVYDNSPLNQNRLGFLSISDSAGSASENLSLDGEIEMKILKKIEHYKAINV